MSSFLVDDRVYQKMYVDLVELHQANVIYLYNKDNNINDFVFNGMLELQKANFETEKKYTKLNFEDIKIKNKNIKDERIYKRFNRKELTQIYKNLQCIKYQIETPYNKSFINYITIAISDAMIRSNQYYEDAHWGSFDN